MRHIIIIIGIAAAVLLSSCASRWQSSEGAVWGTTFHITYKSPVDLGDSIIAVMRQVEQSLSPFSPNSVISRINRGESDEADALVAAVYARAAIVGSASGGAFDPTVAPAVNLWGFGYKTAGTEPGDEQIDSVMALVGFSTSRLQGGRIVKGAPGMEFDFSAITKGFGCDMVGRMLERNGCDDYMVEIGGEIALGGSNRHGEPWHIMVDAPLESDSAVVHERLAVIALTDCGIATSGNYRNYKLTEGGKTWHTIDPRTCRPAITATLSATVIAADAMTADAFATACMVMEPQAALTMVENQQGVEALLVIGGEDGGWEIATSSGFPEF